MSALEADLKAKQGRMLSKLTRVRRRAFVSISNRGSRTQIIEMMKELEDALQSVEDVNEELKKAVSEESEKVHEAEDYMKAAEKQYEDACQRIQEYLKSRQGEEPSVVSGLAKSQASHGSAASQKAEVALQIKQMELKQLERKHQREKEEQDLHRQNELQTAKDAEELARLEVKLNAAAEDSLNWDRRNDFDDEVAAEQVNTAENQKSAEHHRAAEPSGTLKTEVQVNLPRVTLTKFSGSPGEWPRWFALFRTLVHDQKSLTSTEKMVYLQNSVMGSAQQVISGMFYEGSLYEEALRALEDRFGRKEDIVQENMKEIFTCPSPSSQDLQSLEHFHSAVHSTVTVLQNLKYQGDLESTENLRRVVQKLPQELRLAWSKYVVEVEPHRVTLIDFDQWLAKQVRIVQKLTAVTLNNPQRREFTTNTARRTQKQRPPPETRATLTTGMTSSEVSLHCVCCNRSHHLKDCSVFKAKDLDSRAELVLKSGTCFVCLKRGHQIRSCNFNRECGIDGCKMRHHKLLHGSKRVTPLVRESEHRVVAAVTESAKQVEGVTLLQIVPVRVHAQDGQYRDTLALLDPGSQTSLCSEELIHNTRLPGEMQSLCIETVEGRGNIRETKKVQLTLSPLCEGEDVTRQIIVPEAFSVPRVNVRISEIPKKKENWAKWKHLRGIKFPDCTDGKVEVLLGANVLEAVLQREARVGKTGEPVAVRTAFGWALTGTITGFIPPQTRQVMFIHRADAEEAELTQKVEEWWKTESFGTLGDIKVKTSAEDLHALRLLERSVRKCGDRYEAGLLWRNEDVKMPDNREVAMSRLKKLEKSLRRNPEKAEAYGAAIQDYVEAGHARKLSKEEAAQSHDKLWLLPHHAVVSPNKPKPRVVFDAAAPCNGVSLNSELIKGPDMLQNLVGILLRFRQEKVAIVADITQMFHQIQIRAQDQPALSFWWRDLDPTQDPDMYRMQVAIFGAKCSPAIANYVLQKVADDEAKSQDAKKAVKTSFYMDDFVKSEKSVETASEIRREVTDLLTEGGFHITKWISSEEQVLSDVPVEERGSLKEDSTSPGRWCTSVLGCKWNPQDDTLSVKFNPVSAPPTKRGVLKQVASLYDPLGILTPYTLLAKKLIQTLWRRRLDWDELLTGDDLNVWRRWLEEVRQVETAEVPRWYCRQGQESDAEYELHLFSDASEHAFGAVAYVRVLSHGSSYCQFVMARSRLAPLRQLSIVRLELQGAVLSTRVADMIRKETNYEFTRTLFWTDSRVVLQLLKNESRKYHTFVANRVSEIHETTQAHQWRHVPGSQNPADLCSRGQSLSALKEEKDWWVGPAFLGSSETFWPQQEDVGEISSSCEEVRRSAAICTTSKTTLPQREAVPSLAELIEPARFSSWLRYRRVIAWIRRFINNVKSKVAGTARTSGPLRSEEVDAAETIILRSDQGSQQDEKSLAHLSPFFDDQGLQRVGGRLSKAPLAEQTRHPVILRENSEITRMIIEHAHQKVLHSGLERTLCELREKYWVQKMRSTVKKQLRRCPFCRNRRAAPQPPKMADLPEARFDSRRPFSTVGLDYFGPLTVKKFRKTEKRYVLLITCLATRAVHLEVAASMDTDCFLMALRRFIARRGKPHTIYSDNGTNLVGGERELREAIEHWNQNQITDALSQRHIEWVFLPPASPHMGGAWERLVASVKRALRVVLGNQCVSEDVLQTALAEVEFVINGRPLTYVSSDPQDVEPLTPNHFLLGSSNERDGMPPGIFSDCDMIGRKRWRQAQVLADHLWRRWRREYLPSLAARQKWMKENRSIQVDDVVILTEDNTPRGYWPMGRITQVFPGSDGRVRSAEVKTKSGTYLRPATKLCLLESRD